MVSDSPGPPKMTSWWATSPGRRTECNRTPPSLDGAPDAGERRLLGRVGRPRARAGRLAGRVEAPGRGERRSRRRIALAVVVQLDDLDAVEVRRAQLREAHHQDRADREVRGDHAVRPVGVPEGRSEPVEVRGRDAGRAADGVHAVGGAPREVLDGGVRHREVDGDVGAIRGEGVGGVADDEVAGVHAEERVEPPAGGVAVDGGDELEVGRLEHRPAHRGAHPACRPEDAHLGHRVTVAGVQVAKSPSAKGPTTARVRGPVQILDATSATSSSVTPAILPSSSSTVSTSP